MIEIRSKVASYLMNGLGTRLATKWLIHYLDVDSTMKVKTSLKMCHSSRCSRV